MNIVKEADVEYGFVGKLQDLKYTYRKDIRDINALELNFRQKFEALNRVKLTDTEFGKLLTEIINPDVFKTSNRLRKKKHLYKRRRHTITLHFSKYKRLV